MLRKTFEEPGTRPLPHLRKHLCYRLSADSLTPLFVHWRKALTSRCSLQILHSHTARGRLLHCVPHLVHMFCTTGENKDFQLLIILLLQIHSNPVFSPFVWTAAERVCCCFCLVIIGWLITYLFAVLTHHWADSRWAQLLPTEQTAGLSIPTHSLLHVVQTVYQAPAAAQGEIILKMSLLIINVCMSLLFYSLSPNSLLLHGLHFLSTGDHTVNNFFLFICQVWTRTRAWLHGPVAPVSQTYSLVVDTLLPWFYYVKLQSRYAWCR